MESLQRIEPMPVAPSVVEPAPITAAQAKIDAVASLTMAAYARASTLQLTPEEIAAIKADFPDEAFQPGAAGKENLLYIEHAHLRDRLNTVFGPGQWAIVPRNRWAEDFTTGKGAEASRVYVEAMLCIRGCFVAEAVGEMEYWKNNASQNYGDAVEGAKTAALRRCAKELGIGLQAWKKSWCEGWWARKRGGTRSPQPTKPANVPHTKPAPPPVATEKTRDWFLAEMRKRFSDAVLLQWGVDSMNPTYLMPDEGLAEWPLKFVPTSKAELNGKIDECSKFMNVEPQNMAGKPQEASGPPSTSAPGEQNAQKAAARKESSQSEPAHHSEEYDETPQFDENDDEVETVTGKIEQVSEKSGRSAKGPWTRYGIRIGPDFWVNTFSATLGKLASADKGSMVRVQYKPDKSGRGYDLVGIERATKEPTPEPRQGPEGPDDLPFS